MTKQAGQQFKSVNGQIATVVKITKTGRIKFAYPSGSVTTWSEKEFDKLYPEAI